MVVLTPNQCYEINTNSRPVKYKVLILVDELMNSKNECGKFSCVQFVKTQMVSALVI